AVRLGSFLDETPWLENISGVLQGPAVHVGSLSLYWGASPRHLIAPRALTPMEAQIRAIFEQFDYGPASRRPDIVLVDDDAPRALAVIECKHTGDSIADPDQQF